MREIWFIVSSFLIAVGLVLVCLALPIGMIALGFLVSPYWFLAFIPYTISVVAATYYIDKRSTK